MLKLIFLISLLAGMNSCREKIEPDTSGGDPVITSIHPQSGSDLTKVTIAGNNFSSLKWENLIVMGGFHIVPESASSKELVFSVPEGIAPGLYSIDLTVGIAKAAAPGKFEVITSGDPGQFVPPDMLPVTPSAVRKCFAVTKMGSIHPRLLFSRDEIAAIRQTAQSDNFARPTYDMIITRADAIISSPVLDWGLDGANLRISNIHLISNDQIPYLVLAYQFTNDPKYASRCWSQLDRMCSWQDWGAARHFLDAGIAAKGVAIAFDGLYDYLSSDQKQKLAGAVRKFVLEPGKTQIETGTGAWKWYLSDNNWNGICHGGMIMAALACYETDPVFMSSVIAVAANGMSVYFDSFEPDGASEEGMMYWSYGLSNTFLCLESMNRVLSTTFGLAKRNGFLKTGWFPYLVSGPAGTATMGDDYLYYGTANKFLSYFWFAGNTSDANLAKTHYNACMARNSARTEKMNGWFDLIFYDPAMVAKGSPVAAPVNGYIRGAEYMFVYENSNDINSLYIGMHSGDNNASHGHLDAGTFFIQSQGENFIVGNLGKEDPYPSDYFTVTAPLYSDAPTTNASVRGRFYYYRIRTESKSCVVFNPDARPEQNPAGVASISGEWNDNSGGFYIVDLKSCYSRDVTRFNRGIKLNRNAGLITVQDEFVPKTTSLAYWIAQSPATDGMIISNDGRTATMKKNGKTLYAFLRSPANAVFQKIDRSETSVNYLSETAPVFSSVMSGKNSVNKWYGKLHVRIANADASVTTTVRIDFSASPDPAFPSLVPLNNWTTTN